jgi:hypothetical protein
VLERNCTSDGADKLLDGGRDIQGSLQRGLMQCKLPVKITDGVMAVTGLGGQVCQEHSVKIPPVFTRSSQKRSRLCEGALNACRAYLGAGVCRLEQERVSVYY